MIGAVDNGMAWQALERLLSLRDHNTRVVLAGALLLGVAAGVLGCFTLLRKRALMGDALSHATFPGVCLAFMISAAAGGSGKSLPLLLIGATVSGVLGMACVLAIRNWTRLKEDAALGIVLSVFFGAGVALLGVVQRMNKGHAAGLESFIYGKTASMLTSDALLMGGAAIVVLVVTGALFKELRMLCFDPAYAQSQGWPVLGLDCVLLGLVAAVTVIGLQAAGLVLIIAMLVIPAAAARFWTERLPVMLIIAGVFGALSGVVGAGASAVYPKLPSGPMIVLVAAALFLGSMFFGTARGVIPRWVVATRFEAKVRRVHLLRALFEGADGERGMEMERLLEMRSWSEGTLRKEVAMARKKGLLRAENGRTERVELTETGWNAAAQVVRQHRLWETYLIEYADIAPSHVDRDADAIEHVLSPELVAELESLLAARPLLESPHQLSHATQNRPPHG